MSKKIATGAFNDTECTCDCGNKHELYGGVGYDTVSCNSYTPAVGEDGIGFYFPSLR